MKESTAKTKRCPELSKVAAMQNLTATLLHVIAVLPSGNTTLMDKAVKQIGKIVSQNNNSLCTGSGCVMWQPDQTSEEKHFDSSTEEPKGEGWVRTNRMTSSLKYSWQRLVDSDTGDCGLKQWPAECRASC